MNVQPIDRGGSLPVSAANDRAAASGEREALVQRAALWARQLADVMLAHVQNTASLNLTAARALLSHARIPTPAGLERRSDTWRHSWRSFEVCATSADQVLQMSRGHVERTTSALWQATECILNQAALVQHDRLADLRSSFAALREAQAACWQAAQQVHGRLVALVRSPLSPDPREVPHGTH